MATKSCKRPVYRTMCESDDGNRSGRSGNVRYASSPVGRAKPSKATVVKTKKASSRTASASPKQYANTPAIRDLVNRSDAYAAKFDIGYMDVDYMDVLAGDSIIGERRNLVAAYTTARKGRMSSDADIAAFYLAYRDSPYTKELNAMDGRHRIWLNARSDTSHPDTRRYGTRTGSSISVSRRRNRRSSAS